ncbi:hypothetical protein ACHAXS_010563 [Conticribra weissflogii]
MSSSKIFPVLPTNLTNVANHRNVTSREMIENNREEVDDEEFHDTDDIQTSDHSNENDAIDPRPSGINPSNANSSKLENRGFNNNVNVNVNDNNNHSRDDKNDDHPTKSLLASNPPLARLLHQISTPQIFDPKNALNPHNHLHRKLHFALSKEMKSLRESTQHAIQVSYGEKERLMGENERMECQIEYLKHRMDMVKEELLAEDDRFSRHGHCHGDGIEAESGRELWRKFCEIISNEEGGAKENLLQRQMDDLDQKNMQRQQHPTHQKQNNKKPSLLQSVLEKGDDVTSTKKHRRISSSTSASSDNQGPLRNSFLSKIGIGSSHHNVNTSNSVFTPNQTRHDDNHNEFQADNDGHDEMSQSSILDGMGSGMPSRWKARELERERSQRLLGTSSTTSTAMSSSFSISSGVDSNSNSTQQFNHEPSPSSSSSLLQSPKDHRLSQLQLLEHLISLREQEIQSLEQTATVTETKNSELKNEISRLEQEHVWFQSLANDERQKLIRDIARIQSNNEKLDILLLETNVVLEEKMISVDLLGKELRDARKELYKVQQLKETMAVKRKKEERALYRKLSMDTDISAGSGGGGGDRGNCCGAEGDAAHPSSVTKGSRRSSNGERPDQPQTRQNQYELLQKYYQEGEEVQTFQVKTDGKKKGPPSSFRRNNRYQVPANVQEEYNQYLMYQQQRQQQRQQQYQQQRHVGANTRTSDGSASDGESDGEGGGRYVRRQSFQSVNTFTSMVSALTLDSGDMVDLLDEME